MCLPAFRQSSPPPGYCQVAVGDLCEYAVDQCIRLQELPEHVRQCRLSITYGKTLNNWIKIRIWNHWSGQKKTTALGNSQPYPSLVVFRCDRILRQTQHVRLKYDKNWSWRDLFLQLSGSSWRDASQHRTLCSDVRLYKDAGWTSVDVGIIVPVLISTQSTDIYLTVGTVGMMWIVALPEHASPASEAWPKRHTGASPSAGHRSRKGYGTNKTQQFRNSRWDPLLWLWYWFKLLFSIETYSSVTKESSVQQRSLQGTSWTRAGHHTRGGEVACCHNL